MGKTVAVRAGNQSVHMHSSLQLRYLLLGVLCCLVSYLAALYLKKGSAATTHADSGRAIAGSAANFTLSTRVWWMAPFLSAGGYGSEAVAFAMALAQSPSVQPHKLWISQHGDGVSRAVVQKMDRAILGTLQHLMANVQHGPVPGLTTVVCHSGPLAWSAPQPAFETPPCPPAGLGRAGTHVVGRTMFETDRLPGEYVRRCSHMDEIWVPSQWSKDVFQSAGVTVPIHIIPEPVDVEFFSPAGVEPLPLPAGQLVFGQRLADGQPHTKMLSVFKWEERKAWDVLLAAYLEEFSGVPAPDGSDADAPTALYLLTQPYHSSSDFASKTHAWAHDVLGITGSPQRARLPTVYVLTGHISDNDLRRLYKAADAFMLPSRGEGWGRPHAEAMSMALPVIATNWSGPTAFMDASNSYPLSISGLTPVREGPFAGHLWAAPSAAHLRQLLRRVVAHPAEAAERGRQARETMVHRYAPSVVADLVVQRLRDIELHHTHPAAR